MPARPIKAAAKALGVKSVGRVAYDEWARERGQPSSRTLARRHGSWPAACAANGVRPAARTPARWHDSELAAAIKAAAAGRSGPFRLADYVQWRDQQPNSAALPAKQHFTKRWNELCGRAGVTPGRMRTRVFDDDDILDALQRAAGTRCTLTGPQYTAWAAKHPRSPKAITIAIRFGSWTAACGAAGLAQTRYTEPDLIDALQTAAKGPGQGLLTGERYDEWAVAGAARPSRSTITRRFGSWAGALQAAGV